jgi:hypothetical protein
MSSGRVLAAHCSRLVIATVLLYLLVGVALGLGLTTSNLTELAKSQFGSPIGVLHGGIAIAFALAACAWSWNTARRSSPYPIARFIAVLIVASFSARGMLIYSVDAQWASDYLRYWQHAVAMAAEGDISASSFYDQRALLIAYPVAKIFGAEAALALKLVNMTLLVGVQLLAYDVMRIARGHQAAQASSILLLAAPMPAYVTLIPSHDLWGLAFLTIALWAICRALYLPSLGVRQWPRLAGLGAVCTLATYCFELQRGVGTLFALALCLAAFMNFALRPSSSQPCPADTRSRAGVMLVIALVCLFSQPMLGKFGAEVGIHPAREIAGQATQRMKFAAHAGAMGTATSDWYARFRDRFSEKTLEGPQAASEFARSLALSNWIIQPEGKLQSMVAHMPRMFDLGYPNDWDTALRQPTKISATTRGSLVFYAGVFALGFGLLLAVSLAATATDRGPLAPPVVVMTLFLAALSFLLLVLFENKAPNIFPIWLFGSMLIAWIASSRDSASSPALSRAAKVRQRCRTAANVLALAGVVTAGAWLAARTLYTEDDGRIVAGWNFMLKQSNEPSNNWEESLRTANPRAFEPAFFEEERRAFVLRGAPFDGARIHKYSGDLLTILEFPAALEVGDQLTMSREVCGTTGRDLEFFAFSPFTRRDVTNSFTLDVTVDGNVVKRLPIPFRGSNMRLVTIEDIMENDGCHEVSITVTSNVDRTAASWVRASHVEIWFPRLVVNP